MAPSDLEGFINRIAREGAWLIADNIDGGQIKFTDYIDQNGTHIWPLFSTRETAASWVSRSDVREIRVFQCLKLKPEAVVRTIPSRARVVFDARSEYERIMTTDDIAMLKGLIEQE